MFFFFFLQNFCVTRHLMKNHTQTQTDRDNQIKHPAN